MTRAQATTRDATPHCLRLDAIDNVAVVLDDAQTGPLCILNSVDKVDAIEPIARGHKIALRPMDQGKEVIKYGVVIGFATEPIRRGAWVHTHNCRSRIDERSHTLDRHTGAPTDTRYV